DSYGARVLRENFPPEENHQGVAVDYLTAIVNDPNAIPIPIQPDAHVCMFLAHCHDEVTQVFRLHRIGMVMRKPGIRIAVQPDEINAEVFQYLGSNEAGGAIAAVQHDPQPPGAKRDLLL